MRVRMTFDFSDAQRRALARALKCRRPATRTQAVQWLAEITARGLDGLVTEMRARELNPDPDQFKLPLAADNGGAAGVKKTKAKGAA